MGYKLAGFDHLGGVETDKPVADVYRVNHNPKYLYNEDIRLFNQRTELPEELFHLDILDGSPPCSSFSMAGNREKDWGKTKQFREGQAKQTLDDLFFDYIALAKRLQPKVVIAENVKGLIQGNAKAYVHEIRRKFEDAGYVVQLFLLNAASMGVPQKRERVFFICQRRDLKLPKLVLGFDEPSVTFGQVMEKGCQKADVFTFPESERIRLEYAKHGDPDLRNADFRYRGGQAFFNQKFIYEDEVAGTITGQEKQFVFSEKRRLSNAECQLIGSYPLDYNFEKLEPKYLIGMSVPPVMCAQIAHQIYLQWLSNLPGNGVKTE
jgi:DNA (cytosine-5)-methyltransferase 1